MAGHQVVPVACDPHGNIDLGRPARQGRQQHADRLAALMVTYPSTHGVFEEASARSARSSTPHGGQVYMDGANMNAQVGLCRPGDIGADVCHLNLHKTFCIPHGGGGPGMGPIGVAAHLAPFLPGHPVVPARRREAIVGAVSAAPWGSASILPISWDVHRHDGRRRPDRATRWRSSTPTTSPAAGDALPGALHRRATASSPTSASSTAPLKASAGVEVEDIAKRLMDYGFHAPTMSFPVAGTLMIEPTESESKEELDRFCEAMIAIREEIRGSLLLQLPALCRPLPVTLRAVAGLCGVSKRACARQANVLSRRSNTSS
jgi:glycine dehydrogenase